MSQALPGIQNVIAISSGKGGVGKSTVSVNLALALAQKGFRVGLADVDIYGPSIPTLLGLEKEQPKMLNQQLVPISSHDIKVMSMGFLVGQDTPAILRGPMITKFIHQFVTGVLWGELDYLLLDLPPGTGDAQLSLAQTVPLTGALVVTTPQALSVKVALRGLRMFEKVKIPILGVVENMSGWATPSGEPSPFRGGQALSELAGVPYLGNIPMDQTVAISGDENKPLLTAYPAADAVQSFRNLASAVIDQVSLINSGPTPLGQFHWNLSSGQGEPAHREAGETPVPSQISQARRYALEEITPVGLKKAGESGLVIQWQDGTDYELDFRGLRLVCPCAVCVDEDTGERKLIPSMVPLDVKAIAIESVGSYALKFTWSDGHATGLYAFERLRQLGEARAAALATHSVN
ncbi:sodium:proton antiporter [bacterium (Candidatus Blackallbacteria) CG17_big_fil_post_rev_8_21_14_2_50_48_46]|uniref:Iron-sulfur cluster carrier protein n=1 Tax=bacterium (Candidatus Blackallbacteria) CG17_big_fil_post_rev_8_21_14_2_50_48_46 TaxID=2014261 RepID=A0A2M7G3E9_9BACT|nr:MAG: sodium:proton antiporter [bacterium (Candidatus Blackallbacteria) CG18_big_fil_WC_8_21_14_2_50_49_26]PIW15982.1 MAG: sodium:proton antiporter [bacterium (Candidatus Blackallbacteria) CG17_big_fil_post_rev_8_21_14_2_50_48_46]PIW50394.1 MAG: sodium:proton antiporter [bacterium (Candidatus Blackallbacteria) CG13_big_fil_rev_8_21_14_2_50_49_14]